MDGKSVGLIAATAWVLALPCHAQGAVGGEAYRCTVASRVRLQATGELSSDEWTRILDKAYLAFSFDSGSGVLRWEGGDLAWQYRTAQEASADNDLVAIRTLEGSASFVVNVLRIRPWQERSPFLLMEQDEMISGTCRKQ